MKKKLFAVLAVIAVICAMTMTAVAAPFDASLLLPVTEQFDIDKVVTATGDGAASLTEDKTFLVELDGLGFVSAGYAVTTDGSFWATFISHEDNLYASKYMVMQVKNGSQETAISPYHIAFSGSVTTPVSISGNEEYPIVLVNDNGEYQRATVEFSLDAWYVVLPADFSGYIVIPNERLTSDISEENTEGVGDYMAMRTEQDYRFFWQLNIYVENRGEEETTLEWVNMFAVSETLDFDLPAADPTEDPTETPTETPTEVASQGASVTPGQSTAAAQTQQGGFPTWAWIVIAVVVVAIIVVAVIAASKKKKEN